MQSRRIDDQAWSERLSVQRFVLKHAGRSSLSRYHASRRRIDAASLSPALVCIATNCNEVKPEPEPEAEATGKGGSEQICVV